MKKSDASSGQSASELISKRIAELADWRGKTLARMRQLIAEADPEVVEEWKWMGTPIFSHDGIICTGESYKQVVKLTFAKGASLKDPARLFNSSLDGNVRRAIDIHEGEAIDEDAFKTLVRQAVALNTASKSKSSKAAGKSNASKLQTSESACLEVESACLEVESACLEVESVACLEVESVACLEVESVACLEAESACLEVESVACLEVESLACLEAESQNEGGRAALQAPEIVTIFVTRIASAEYSLTSIYSCEYIQLVESSFAVVAEPNRRAILGLLLSSERSVSELEHELRLSQPSVSKHLRVLRDAGFVDSRIEAQRRVYRLRPEPLMELDAWLVPFRRFWSKHLDALEQHLDKMEQVSSVKGKKKT